MIVGEGLGFRVNILSQISTLDYSKPKYLLQVLGPLSPEASGKVTYGSRLCSIGRLGVQGLGKA